MPAAVAHPRIPSGKADPRNCASRLVDLSEVSRAKAVPDRQFSGSETGNQAEVATEVFDCGLFVTGNRCDQHAFGKVIHERRYTCYACAVLPDHAYVVFVNIGIVRRP